MKSADLILKEKDFCAQNYDSIPAVLTKGLGVYVWDVDGKRYFDFLSAYSAVNQGHCHPKIITALTDQCSKLTLVSRAFHNDKLVEYAQFITEYFGYERVLPCNTGVEAGETAVKLCRKWAYNVKKIESNEAQIIFAANNFWGRSIAAVSSSTDPLCYEQFGPFTPGFVIVPYDDIEALEAKLKLPNTAGFYVEPIQGEAGVIVPSDGYIKAAADLCRKYNVLFIADEIQTGLGRTGKMLCCDHEGVKPDILVLGKALSGGVLPVSAVLCSLEIMSCIKAGEHGSTYGGNPLACSVAMAALTVLKDERMCERSTSMGALLREKLSSVSLPWIKEIRGKGLLNAIELYPSERVSAWDLCLRLAENGLLCKPTHGHIIRLSPPLVITEEQMLEACKILIDTFMKYNESI